MTFVDFMKKVNSMYNNHKKKMRYGQILMNFLSEVWPYKYIQIASTSYDCYYDDSIVLTTVTKLEYEWDDNSTEYRPNLNKHVVSSLPEGWYDISD